MKNFILLALTISLLPTASFAEEIISAVNAHPVTISRQVSTHSDGQQYVSFELMKDGQPVRHLGKLPEVPLSWLQAQPKKQRLKTEGALGADIGGVYVGACVGTSVLVLGETGSALASWGGAAAGGVGAGLVKSLNPHQQYLRGKAVEAGLNGDLKLKNNAQVELTAKNLETVLNEYDTRTTKRTIQDDSNEARDAIDNRIAKAWNGAVGLAKTMVSSSPSGEIARQAVLSSAESAL